MPGAWSVLEPRTFVALPHKRGPAMSSDTPAKTGITPDAKADEIRLGLADGHQPANGDGHHQGHATASYAALALGALGVVYGDIGTSPLYALKEVFAHGHVLLTAENNTHNK